MEGINDTGIVWCIERNDIFGYGELISFAFLRRVITDQKVGIGTLIPYSFDLKNTVQKNKKLPISTGSIASTERRRSIESNKLEKIPESQNAAHILNMNSEREIDQNSVPIGYELDSDTSEFLDYVMPKH